MKLEFLQDTAFSMYSFKRGQVIERDSLHQSLVALLLFSKRVKLVDEPAKEGKRK